MKVLKFGGTSVATPESLQLVKEIIKQRIDNGQLAVVVSALGGVTNQLVECSEKARAGDLDYEKTLKELEDRHLSMCKELLTLQAQSPTLSQVKIMLNDLEDVLRGVFLLKELSKRASDTILGFGERLSSLIIWSFLNSESIDCELVDSGQLIQSEDHLGHPAVDFPETSKRIVRYHEKNRDRAVLLFPGFISSDAEGKPTTLGRGGSDYTAAIIANSLNAESLEIWTDVNGVMTAHPKWVSRAKVISELLYEEAMELSHFGAKVIYPPTIQPVLKQDIPIYIKNTFRRDAEGTKIHSSFSSTEKVIKGLSSIEHMALLTLKGSGMVGIPSFSYRLFKALSNARVNVILITQASSEHSITVGIDQKDAEKAKNAVNNEFQNELKTQAIEALKVELDLSVVALVGANMKEQVGVSGRMFETLGENGVNIKAIAQGSSELNISVVIKRSDLKKSLNVLHESFFLSERKRVNLFIIGVGNVGSSLIDQIEKQGEYLYEEHRIDIRVIALANSKKLLVNEEGINLKEWQKELSSGEKMTAENFLSQMKSLNLRNSIFIDNTAEKTVAELYKDILSSSISVVTPNKIACADSYENYLELKSIAKKYGARFLFETNVAAGLPVISTLNELINSGDRILKIQAVLSGSLNFIFNNYRGERPFAKIVRRAKEEGYTEPDPRIDLSGVDVQRKILILIRESKIRMNIQEIKGASFLPEGSLEAESVDDFFKAIEAQEAFFQKMFNEANSQGKKLKYVAQYENGKASSGLKEVSEDHPFYHLEGKDNIIVFYTERYKDQPLIIKGAGAGAEVTASGIFADVMRIAHQ
ncbi:MAG: bifunctional aspartate kinase/homoserine dehydrogenase I [Bacteroidota bacterium]